MNKKDLLKNTILYLIEKLGDGVEGKKKLMKLMFLLEHYDLEKKKLKRDGLLSLDYQIYYYGVFSREVSDIISGLINSNDVEDGFPLKTKQKPSLGDSTKNRVDAIINEFGKKSGYALEVETLKMLGYEPSDKAGIFGKEVKELIKQ